MTARPPENPGSLKGTNVLLYITSLFFSRELCYVRSDSKQFEPSTLRIGVCSSSECCSFREDCPLRSRAVAICGGCLNWGV